MNSIIVATDFSPAARKAAEIGARIASFSGAQLILFHGYNVPAGLLEAVMIKAAYEEAVTKSTSEMTELVRHLKHHNPDGLKIKTVCRMGSVVEELGELSRNNHADLIVTGTSALGRWEEVLVGNTATEIIRQLDIPILAVPETSAGFPPRKIAIACTTADVISKSAANALILFENIFLTEILLVHVVKNRENQSKAAYSELERIQELFKEVNPSTYIIEDEQTNTGLKKFIDDNEVDWLVMFPEHHDLAERLFLEIHTRNILVSSHVPVLAFPAAR